MRTIRLNAPQLIGIGSDQSIMLPVDLQNYLFYTLSGELIGWVNHWRKTIKWVPGREKQYKSMMETYGRERILSTYMMLVANFKTRMVEINMTNERREYDEDFPG